MKTHDAWWNCGGILQEELVGSVVKLRSERNLFPAQTVSTEWTLGERSRPSV